jgi:hypothetical protein
VSERWEITDEGQRALEEYRRSRRVYIAGPMTGHPDWNFPAFHAAASAWRELGWEVINPAEAFGGQTDLPYSAYVQQDLADLQRCAAIALLPGWDGENARGSVWERYVGEMLLGLRSTTRAGPCR